VLETLVAREPQSIDARARAGRDSLTQDDVPESLRWHLRLQELGDRSAEVLHNTGLLLFRTGDMEGAIRNYREAVDAKPDFAKLFSTWATRSKAFGMQKRSPRKLGPRTGSEAGPGARLLPACGVGCPARWDRSLTVTARW